MATRRWARKKRTVDRNPKLYFRPQNIEIPWKPDGCRQRKIKQLQQIEEMWACVCRVHGNGGACEVRGVAAKCFLINKFCWKRRTDREDKSFKFLWANRCGHTFQLVTTNDNGNRNGIEVAPKKENRSILALPKIADGLVWNLNTRTVQRRKNLQYVFFLLPA